MLTSLNEEILVASILFFCSPELQATAFTLDIYQFIKMFVKMLRLLNFNKIDSYSNKFNLSINDTLRTSDIISHDKWADVQI